MPILDILWQYRLSITLRSNLIVFYSGLCFVHKYIFASNVMLVLSVMGIYQDTLLDGVVLFSVLHLMKYLLSEIS